MYGAENFNAADSSSNRWTVVKRWLMEPMLHFIVVGALLFAADGLLNRRGEGDNSPIVRVTASEVDWLRETWTRQWQRPPDERELRGLISDYLKEGLLAREAREWGLDENDTIVRRRLAQKMEFLVQNTARLPDPLDEELLKLYTADSARNSIPAQISLSQIFFKTEAAARQALSRLESQTHDPVGDPSLLDTDYDKVDQKTLSNLLGADFAESVFGVAAGGWQGPFASGYGFHLVRIKGREAARQRPFDEVRQELLDAWHQKQQADAYRDFIAALFDKYEVIVEWSGEAPLDLLAEGSR
jgi:PPIC-type PPIASE domain